MFSGTVSDRTGPLRHAKVLGREIPFINTAVTLRPHGLAVLLVAVCLVQDRFVVRWGGKLVAATAKRFLIIGLIPVECDDVFPVVGVVDRDMPVEASGWEGIEVGKDQRSNSYILAFGSDGAKLADSETNVDDFRFASLHRSADGSRSIGPSLFPQIPITVMKKRYVE